MSKHNIRSPKSLLKPEIAVEYFEQHREELFGTRKLHVKKVTPWTIRARNFVCFFDIVAGEPRAWKRAVGLADSGNQRVKEHARLQALWAQGKSEQYFAMPEPIFLDKQLGMSFITHIPGDTLADVVRNHRGLSTPILRNIARWLKNLHSIPPENIPYLARGPQLKWAKLDVQLIKKVAPEFAPKLVRAWNVWEARWKRDFSKLDLVLSHGDFHSFNIKRLPHSNNISVMDFGLLCRAPKFWDLASFLTQVDAIHGRYLKQREVLVIRRGMLAAWEKEFGKLTKSDKEQLEWLEQFFRIGTTAYLLSRDPYPHIKRLYSGIKIP